MVSELALAARRSSNNAASPPVKEYKLLVPPPRAEPTHSPSAGARGESAAGRCWHPSGAAHSLTAGSQHKSLPQCPDALAQVPTRVGYEAEAGGGALDLWWLGLGLGLGLHPN